MSFITFDAAIVTYHITKLYQFAMINSIIDHLHNLYQTSIITKITSFIKNKMNLILSKDSTKLGKG